MLQIKKIFALAFLLFSSIMQGQETPDAVFDKAHKLAVANKFEESIELVKSLHANYPQNNDYSLYLGYLYHWSNQNQEAEKMVAPILKANPLQKEAYDLMIKIKSRLSEYNSVVELADQGKQKFPESEDFYKFQKAMALEKLNNNTEAVSELESIPSTSQLKKDADYLQTQIEKKKKNSIAIGNLYTNYDNSPAPLNITHLEYSRKVKTTTLIGRINYGTSSDRKNLLGELDAYIKLKSKGYFYLNTGISGNENIFPKYKFGAEYYQDFKKISTSLGARYLGFNQDNNVLLLTGHLGVAVYDWKIEYRHYLSNSNDNWFSSSILNFRKNFEATESYIQLDLQYGTLPYFFLNNDSFQRLNAYRIGLNSKFRIKKDFFIQPIVMYEREEFIPTEYRNRITGQLILSKRF
ncbi:YaiO family outer membrane beta-barrel protein [Flavobacterium sp. H122]|uniref:YaiO family outer membrane beta-barrel protein n=1 Tax=Flavobacterium sp. H122 TaxID=2529860 RepID=UPI0010AA3ABE|nr:YaiO family outer membrane beta-barrel protein [Flavobacterium sp. H122]